MSSTLTDRYVWDVTRRLPSDQRDDIERELRSTIADMSEGVDERTALVELGDPARLAANYRVGGRALIGEGLYPEYVRQLRRWLGIVVPLLTAISVAGAAAAEDVTVGSVITALLASAAMAVLQVCFWVTGVFALLERFGTGDTPDATAWDPDDLPEVPSAPHLTIGETVGEVALTLIVVSLLFVQRRWSPVQDADGEGVPLLDPDLWSGPIWLAIALLLAGAALVVLAYLRSSWSWPLAGTMAVVDVALLLLVAWAAFTEQVVDPAFLAGLSDELGQETTWQPNPWLITVLAGGVLLWDAWEALRAAAEAERRPAAAGLS